MPDVLNKQSIVNLLIDSPLREPIKINLIDIVNNTPEVDLPKVYSTITKELEIFQKATERRMKLAEETIAKLSAVTPTPSAQTDIGNPPPMPEPMNSPATPATSVQMDSGTSPMPEPTPPTPESAPSEGGLTPPSLDIPPVSEMPKLESAPAMPANNPPPMPNFQPLGGAPVDTSTDEQALAEIQKELDSLKTSTATEVASAATPPSAPPAPAQQ